MVGMTKSFTEDDSFRKAYVQSDTELRNRQTRIGTLLGVIFMPLGSSLEYFIYPEHLASFFYIRITNALIHLLLFLLLLKSVSKQTVQLLGILWAITPVIAISTMIYLSTGSESPYYAGLNLMIIVTCQLLPYTLKESIIYCLAVLATYVIACFFHIGTPFNATIFYNNVYFIILTSIISVIAGHYYNKRRIQDFILNHELDLRNKQLEELNKMKSNFFANISHELRTPLTLILAPVQQILQSSSQLSDKVAELLHTVQNNGLRLLKLVNDLLEIIRLEEGNNTRFFLEPIEINAFLAVTVSSMDSIATSRNIVLKQEFGEGKIIVEADSYALERVFMNILGNAIKFTPAQGIITVKSRVINNVAVVDITDTGIGISMETLPYIFDRFRQADSSSTRKYQGSGIGLALVKELVEQMQGEVIAESQPNIGTTFRITLPLSKKSYGGNETENMPVKSDLLEPFYREAELAMPLDVVDAEVKDADFNKGKALVLIVDDEPDMRRYLMNSLQDSYSIVVAKDGKEGLRIARTYMPDMILLDFMLPEIDGLTVCRELKGDSKTRKIKIMLLTARIDEHAKITALTNGADDFLTKPFSQMEVKTRLHNLYRTAKLEGDLHNKNQSLEELLKKLKRTQASLIQSEKLNALGSLAAGLLHEINNPLNYALTALQIAISEPDIKDNEELQETFADIDEGMRRIQRIISSLHTFTHPSGLEKQAVFSFSAAVESALRFTAHDRDNIIVECNIPDDDAVIGSESHIIQVLINLLSNAYKASRNMDGEPQGKIEIIGKRRGGDFYVCFKDNGVGMDDDTVRRIFEPFYSTRDVGEGMGMGLSISHTIIENHGSELTVSSKRGQGTEFRFALPVK